MWAQWLVLLVVTSCWCSGDYDVMLRYLISCDFQSDQETLFLYKKKIVNCNLFTHGRKHLGVLKNSLKRVGTFQIFTSTNGKTLFSIMKTGLKRIKEVLVSCALELFKSYNTILGQICRHVSRNSSRDVRKKIFARACWCGEASCVTTGNSSWGEMTKRHVPVTWPGILKQNFAATSLWCMIMTWQLLPNCRNTSQMKFFSHKTNARPQRTTFCFRSYC